MTFDELIDIRPDVNLATFIQLWLLGYDDKIYIDVSIGDKEILCDTRIISEELVPYYEYKIAYLKDNRGIEFEGHGSIGVVLKSMKENIDEQINSNV